MFNHSSHRDRHSDNDSATGWVTNRSRRHSRGQALAEFAIILPVLLALVGVTIDVARLYQAWTNLESATRDAAQYLATSNTDPLAADHTTQGLDSDSKASYIVELATGTSFSRSLTQGTIASCTQPRLTTTYGESTSTSVGGSTAFPVATAKVMTCMPFRTLFAYPFVTVDGSWILRSEREIKSIVGR
jgi:Flp pilus assembly protein TadG